MVNKEFTPWYFQPEIAKVYESFYEGKYKDADIQEKNLLKFLIDQIDDVNEILEVGCGTGHFTRWLNSLGYNVVGADISPVMLGVAKELWTDGKFVNAKAEFLPFKDKSFDVVLYVACLEYMPDLVKVFQEAERVARKGIVMGLMNKWSLPTIRRIIQVKLGKNPYYCNARFYSLLTIKRKLRQALEGKNYEFLDWRCAVFPRVFRVRGLLKIPFGGSFLGFGVKFK
ncbi:Methyltransferase domain-containing protein [Candidatus Kryptobacter tengchongensis]|uniref:Methyltransferase domain-containing protein n=1 Tax=Kryptobacter tengchongensis TaxID=1643429 RepID=A0A656D4T2_KRYT1|nr:class I SAM-dependent methyltransferase [Candidatus Kryptobacter tengchongensis]CUS99606.1 Methyltransferase domain-containing protein [Candidatus Kryptobacter tengchongensis]CUU07759.1 Methyltransferase domain-containing protein [Candidatus Kryptobacter tengchongensis]